MDIKEIMGDIKQAMLEVGHAVPTLIMENKGGKGNYLMFANFPDTTEKRLRILFATGRRVGASPKSHGDLVAFCLVSEVWVAEYGSLEEAAKYKRIADDPNRKETLMVQMMTISDTDTKMELCSAEILRSGAGIDLLDRGEPEECQSALLQAFYAGYRSGLAGGPEDDGIIMLPFDDKGETE